jgi:hypothetical protein
VGDPIFVESEKQFATIYYRRRRGRPKPVKIRRSISRGLFLVGVTIWACEGTRTRPYELEIANSSESLAKLFLELLRQIGISRFMTLRIHAPIEGYERYRATLEENVGNR